LKWACKLLKLNKINYEWLSRNPSKWAYKLLMNRSDKIDWQNLSENTSIWAYKLLKDNPFYIKWNLFSQSPHIFKLVNTNKYYKLFDIFLHKKSI
jgi:hypothetical protein